MKARNVAAFALKKPLQISKSPTVFRALFNFRSRPALRFGLRRDQGGRFRDPRFVSFMSSSNRKSLDTDLHDTVLKGRKLMRSLLKLALFGGGAWVVLESARALSVF